MKQQKNHKIEILPIGADDVLSVFELSNMPSVRANSFNAKPIELSSHRNWFSRKLEDSHVIMFKVTADGDFVGQSRLEIEGNKAIIGISINEVFRGKGLASKLIAETIKATAGRDIVSIEAFIKPVNQASIRLFEKNGFVYDSKVEISGCKALRYILKMR